MDVIRNLIEWFINFVLHMDKELPLIVQNIGIWSYLVLFVVIFIETGVVIMPFLPGDSLLFAAGAVAANTNSGLSIVLLHALMAIAAVLGRYSQLLDRPFSRTKSIYDRIALV